MLMNNFKPTTVKHWGSVYGATVAESTSSLTPWVSINKNILIKEMDYNEDKMEASGSSKMCQAACTSAWPKTCLKVQLGRIYSLPFFRKIFASNSSIYKKMGVIWWFQYKTQWTIFLSVFIVPYWQKNSTFFSEYYRLYILF